MHITPKVAVALQHLHAAPGYRITRCHKGFGRSATPNAPLITRRTANMLVCASLADFNDRFLPSDIALTEKGLAAAQTLALKVAA